MGLFIEFYEFYKPCESFCLKPGFCLNTGNVAFVNYYKNVKLYSNFSLICVQNTVVTLTK